MPQVRFKRTHTFFVLGYLVGHLLSAGASGSVTISATVASVSGSAESAVFSGSLGCELISTSGEDGCISEHTLTVLCRLRCCPI